MRRLRKRLLSAANIGGAQNYSLRRVAPQMRNLRQAFQPAVGARRPQPSPYRAQTQGRIFHRRHPAPVAQHIRHVASRRVAYLQEVLAYLVGHSTVDSYSRPSPSRSLFFFFFFFRFRLRSLFLSGARLASSCYRGYTRKLAQAYLSCTGRYKLGRQATYRLPPTYEYWERLRVQCIPSYITIICQSRYNSSM